MSKHKFKSLIAQNKIKEAIEYANSVNEDRHVEDDLLIQIATYNRNKNDYGRGTVTDESWRMVLARLTYALTQIADRIDWPAGEVRTSSHTEEVSVVKTLQTLYRENHRRRPAEAVEIKVLLEDYQKYDGEKTLKPSYDPSGRRRKALDARFQVLVHKLKEAKDDGLEAFVDRVTVLLSDPIPVYNDLDEAYRLIAGRGCQDGWVETQLSNRPNDMETRIRVAEKLEDLLTTAKQK